MNALGDAQSAATDSRRAGCRKHVLLLLIAAGCIYFGMRWLVGQVSLHLETVHGARAVAQTEDLADLPAMANVANIESVVLQGLKQDYDTWFRGTCDTATYAAIVRHLAGDSACQQFDTGIAAFKPYEGFTISNSLYLDGEMFELGSPVRFNPSPVWWNEAELSGRQMALLELYTTHGGSRSPARRYYLFYDPATQDLRASIVVY